TWTPETRLVTGAFGADVPEDDQRESPDALIVPLLAFDRRGHRLGYGGGFYDRTLAELCTQRRVLAAGFAYDGQRVEHVPSGVYDKPLDAVITEQGVYLP
ncbi:MAG: 5-formyltetrahydrofolate cyclo-ligase, partial [Pseudomonadota bacterium]